MINNEKYCKDIERYLNNVNLDFLNNKRIFITGSTGLICSYLIDLLMKYNELYDGNIHVYALSRSMEKIEKRFNNYINSSYFHPIIGDVCNHFDIVDSIDYIIHGASNTHPVFYSTKPIETITTNVIGLNNLLELAVMKNTTRVLFLSSVEVYGENDKNIDSFLEKDLGYIDCNTLRAGYPESKRLGEALCQAYIEEKKLDIIIPRISRVYGPTLLEDDSKALSQFLHNVVNNQDIILKSDGNQFFSYSYVGDVVLALLLLLRKGKNGEAYNVSDEKSNIYLKDLALLVASCCNKRVLFEIPSEIEQKGFSKATKAIINSQKLIDLGYEAITPLKVGIPLTIDILKETKKD